MNNCGLSVRYPVNIDFIINTFMEQIHNVNLIDDVVKYLRLSKFDFEYHAKPIYKKKKKSETSTLLDFELY